MERSPEIAFAAGVANFLKTKPNRIGIQKWISMLCFDPNQRDSIKSWNIQPWTKPYFRLSGGFDKLIKSTLLLLVAAYRTLGTLHLGGACRFHPSCSEYAVDALHHHPWHKALPFIFHRLLKCRPGGPVGYDPVPISQMTEKTHAE